MLIYSGFTIFDVGCLGAAAAYADRSLVDLHYLQLSAVAIEVKRSTGTQLVVCGVRPAGGGSERYESNAQLHDSHLQSPIAAFVAGFEGR